MKRFCLVTTTLVLLVVSVVAFGQRYTSGRGTANTTLKGKKISIDYGRPQMHGRKIYGELVPFDQVWRTGANEATGLTTEGDIVIGGTTVPMGKYTLFTVPSAKGWKLIVSKVTGEWGIPYKPEYEKQELARIDMKVEALPAPVEEFTIAFAPSGNDAMLHMDWEKTRASVKVSAK